MSCYHGYHASDSSCSDEDSERFRSGESEDEEEDEERYYWPFHHVGAPNDVLQPQGEPVKKLSQSLVNVADTTEELNSFGEAAGMLPGLPGLIVNDCGYVSLPLREENAGQLKIRETHHSRQHQSRAV